MAKSKYLHSVGKRKTAVARIYMKPGSGKMVVNGRDLETYLIRATSRMVVNQPFELTGTVGEFDVLVNVKGGGLNGQAGAIRHALSRALSSEVEHKTVLKANGLLTRDARKKERKLYGQKGARARYQFSKR